MKGKDRLFGVNSLLIDFVTKLDKVVMDKYNVEVTVAEGVRSLARQKELFAQGKSKTLKSKHLTGNAIDIYPIKDRKIYWDFFDTLIKEAKIIDNTTFTYGYDWGWDKPHVEIKGK